MDAKKNNLDSLPQPERERTRRPVVRDRDRYRPYNRTAPPQQRQHRQAPRDRENAPPPPGDP